MSADLDLDGLLGWLDTRPWAEDGVAPYAFFDADHTLWSADLADVAVRRALAERRLKPEAQAALAPYLEAAGLKPSGEVHADYQALFARYMDGGVGELAIVEAMVLCFAGWLPAELVELGSEVMRDSVDALIYEGVDRLHETLRGAGLKIRVVSGTAQWLVEAGAARLGVEPRHVFGVRAAVEDGVLVGRMATPISYRTGKSEAMDGFVPKAADGRSARVALALGDSLGDESMFERAAARVPVNPRPSLRAHVAADAEPARWRVWMPSRTRDGAPVHAITTDRIVV